MTPLPFALGGRDLIAWRLDEGRHGKTWDSGEGAYRFGGRWNTPGVRAVYSSIDPATAILEVAVHKGFDALDIVAQVVTAVLINETAEVRVIRPEEVANPGWLEAGIPSAGQQAFGNDLLAKHGFVVLPSVVSRRSWNLIFVAERVAGNYRMLSQERFVLDTRLNPAR